MKKWKLVMLAVASASLAGCWQSDYAFEGKYFAAEGEECATPTSASDREQYLLDITKQVHDGKALYSARFPIAAKLGAPLTSEQSVAATDDNELTFRFTKPEVSGVFSGSPAVEIELTVVPNKSRKDHLWMKKTTFTSVRDGKVIERDFLTTLRAANKVGESGACLRKDSGAR